MYIFVTARFLQPMAAFSREIQSYKYFVEESGGGNREIMDRKVYDEKKKAPARYASTLLLMYFSVLLY